MTFGGGSRGNEVALDHGLFLGGIFVGGALAPVGYVITYITWGAIEQWNKYRRQPALPLTTEKDG